MSNAAPSSIATFLMFEGRAEEAMNLYVSLFEGSTIDSIVRYGPNEDGREGTVMHASFTLKGQPFMCIDSAVSHGFSFTPSISLFVTCDSAAEFDRLFASLSEGGAVLMPPYSSPVSEQFAWLQDRFGVSWQLNLPKQ